MPRFNPGWPGLVDVLAEVEGRGVVHVPLGLRAPGEEARFMPEGEDPVLGLFESDGGVAVAFEATHDGEAAALLLQVVADEEVDPALVRHVRTDDESVTLAFEDRLGFTVFNDVVDGPRPGLEMLVALDEVGFNHLAAPIAVWRRGGRDLGLCRNTSPVDRQDGRWRSPRCVTCMPPAVRLSWRVATSVQRPIDSGR